MGAEISSLPALPTANFFCITFTYSDKITLLYVSQQEIDICRQAILTHWSNGIQEEKTRMPIENSSLLCYKFKLSGYPFENSYGTRESSVEIRRMATKMLGDLYNIGWRLIVSSDLSRETDYSTWFFERQMVKPNSFPFFNIGLSSWDQLQINDCPPHILKLIQEVVTKNWTDGIQHDKEAAPGSHNIKLRGTPWNFVGKEESCHARHLIREIISILWNNQWILYGTANMKSTADTLFFMYDDTQLPGQEFVTVSLNCDDRMRLINVPDHVISSVDDVVRMNWSKGIQEVKDERPFCYELKFRGYPWWADGSEAIASRKLIVSVMERMTSIGYYPISSIDISRKLNDKSLLVFKRGPTLRTPFFCLSLNSTDYVRIINAPANIVEVAKSIISHWPKGLQDEGDLYDGVSFQAKLRGNPWCYMFNGDGFHGRALLLALWTSFRNLGWRLVCSADVSAKYIHQHHGPDYPLDVHSWYFMYDESLLAFQGPPPPVANTGLYPDIPPPVYSEKPPSFS